MGGGNVSHNSESTLEKSEKLMCSLRAFAHFSEKRESGKKSAAKSENTGAAQMASDLF